MQRPNKLTRTWNRLKSRFSRQARRRVDPLRRRQMREADAIVTCNEVTDRHGTGVILSRIFGESPNILSIRSTQLYPEHSLGEGRLLFRHEGLSRRESFERVLYALNLSTVRRVVCVPYHPDELLTAIILKEVFGAPLCTFVMDDNNVFSHGIPDELMAEALRKSDLRLAISPELRDAYESKYNLKFFMLPPIVSPEAIQPNAIMPALEQLQNRRGALVGTLWSKAWLDKLRATIKQAGLQIDWFGNAKAPWLKVEPEELRQDGINDCGFLPEAELTERLKEYAFALIPSGTLDAEDDRPEIARLSLPTRVPYLLAASNTPMVVLGSPETAAARFIERFQVGAVAPYDSERLRDIVIELCRPEKQLELRQRAAVQSSLFSAKDLAPWIWKALAAGEPPDDRFEKAFCRKRGEVSTYLEAPTPKDLQGDQVLVYQALRRLQRQGFCPDFVLDVGASSGVWSDVASRLFPTARFILVDPLHSHYMRLNDWYYRKHPEFESVPVAVSNQRGEADLGVSDDLYGSTLLKPVDFRTYEPIKVPVWTLNDVAREKQISGRGLLKIDVQFAEHLVLEGARELLPQVDALLLELSLVRYAPQTVLFQDMCDLLRSLGFRYYEDTGGWRSPVDGTPLQKDVLFLRENLFVEAQALPPETESSNHSDGNGNSVLSPDFNATTELSAQVAGG